MLHDTSGLNVHNLTLYRDFFGVAAIISMLQQGLHDLSCQILFSAGDSVVCCTVRNLACFRIHRLEPRKELQSVCAGSFIYSRLRHLACLWLPCSNTFRSMVSLQGRVISCPFLRFIWRHCRASEHAALLSAQGEVQVMPFAAQLLQLAISRVCCVAQGLLVQVQEQLPCPAWAQRKLSMPLVGAGRGREVWS